MDDALLVILSIVGLLALYWVLFGQKKYNKMMEEKKVENGTNQTEKSEPIKKDEQK